MNFKSYLEEGRDAPLYHTTYLDSFIGMLIDDMIQGVTNQGEKFDWDYKKDKTHFKADHFTGSKTFKGISLTRDMGMINRWAPIALELNQRKLTQRYKIVPLNLDHALHPNDSKYVGSSGSKRGDWFEEFLIGDIKNLHLYLKRIIVKNKGMAIDVSMKLEQPEYSKARAVIPDDKIYIYPGRTFIDLNKPVSER